MTRVSAVGPDLLDGREIIEAAASAGHHFGSSWDPQTTSRRRNRAVAGFALRLLENVPDDTSVLELREAIQDAYPGVQSGGGI